MSSHHFVKEKQEPLLIVQSLSPELMELLVQLLEWSPETIVFQTEKNLALLESFDIQPDWMYNSEQKTLTNTFTKERHVTVSENLEDLSNVLKYSTYNTIIDCSYSEYKIKKSNNNENGLTKVVLTNALVQCCKYTYKKWLPKATYLFINCGKLECLNMDLYQKNNTLTIKKESDGFNLFLKDDFLLDLSFDGNFKTVEFY